MRDALIDRVAAIERCKGIARNVLVAMFINIPKR